MDNERTLIRDQWLAYRNHARALYLAGLLTIDEYERVLGRIDDKLPGAKHA
jgi:hypothetical protein